MFQAPVGSSFTCDSLVVVVVVVVVKNTMLYVPVYWTIV